MKVLLFLSRFTFICNIAFLLFVFFSWREAGKPAKAVGDRLIDVPIAKELIIILGFTAILINVIMNIVCLIYLLSRRSQALPRWLIVANFLFLLLQFCYFFLFNNT
jgi:hypothetical protein